MIRLDIDKIFLIIYNAYDHRCRHCTDFHPTWQELGKLVNTKDSKFAIAQVDCTQHFKLCQENDITGIFFTYFSLILVANCVNNACTVILTAFLILF